MKGYRQWSLGPGRNIPLQIYLSTVECNNKNDKTSMGLSGHQKSDRAGI